MNRPIALVCYICGREFGTKSLAIHIKSCQKKWENEQALKPPRERRPCPQPPKGLNDMLQKDNITKNDIQSMNSGAFDTYKEEALIQCEYCGRRFNPTSLKPHQKACKINPMIRKPTKGAPQNQKEEEHEVAIKVPSKGYNLDNIGGQEPMNQNLQECYKCGRKFASDRLQKHQKVCKGQGIKKAEKAPPPPPPKASANKKPEKDPKWKIQHQQFQNALKYMKQMKKVQAQGGKITDLPPPPKSNYDHYVECQYCGRKYAKDVAERHIPKCKDIINKPGGIKPSQIQQKYISGTGAQRPKPQVNVNPTFATTKPNVSNPNYGDARYGNPKPTVPQGIRNPSNDVMRSSSGMKSSPTKPQSMPKPPGPGMNQQYGRIFKK